MPYVSSKELPLSASRTFITGENVEHSARNNAFNVRPAIKTDILKYKYQLTENKTCQISNKYDILNLTS